MKNPLRSPHRHGIVLAVCVAACSPTESSPEIGQESGETQSVNEPGPLAPGVIPPAQPPECRSSLDKPCMLYRIPLLGNPSTDVPLRNKYIAAFGSACYMSEVDTFDCFYKTWQKACADAVKIGEVWGGAPYDTGYTCQPVGNGDYTLQIGPDIALYITINYQKAPRETPLIPVNGTPTEVNGPYRDLPAPDKLGPGRNFHCADVDNNGTKMEQWEWILQLNRNKNGGQIRSDLAGWVYPCKDKNGNPMTCMEELDLKDPKSTSQYDPFVAQVHHVVPMKDQRSCWWGTNSNKNAAVISRRLNIYLTNSYPPADEVVQLNSMAAYPP